MYEWVKQDWTAPNGVTKTFVYRADTNDENVIRAAFVEDEYKVLSLAFEPNDIVLDLGAHIGAVALLFTTIRPDLKIYAFEPVDQNFELLKKNVELNPYGGEMNIFKQAVWFYDDDEVKLYLGDNSPGGTIHRFIGSQFVWGSVQSQRRFVKARTVSLSKVFEENHITHCKFMKMDVEGAEYGIFKGCPKEVLEMIDRIHGEWHHVTIEGVEGSRQKLFEQTKGVFRDETTHPGSKDGGPFVFVKK